MKRSKSRLVALLPLFFLQGCDFVGGLIRYTEFEGSMDQQCVVDALTAVDGISDIRHSEDDYGYHRFHYVVEGIENKLVYEISRRNEVRYWNDYSFLNTVPKFEDVETIRPYLLEIDRNIEAECNVEISEFVVEGCSRMECDWESL